jgi:hypothetical protein
MKAFNATMATTALLGMLILPAARAGFLADFTGWTEMNDCPPCDATTSHTVYHNTGGNWLEDPDFADFQPHIMAGSVTGEEVFVYLYQVVNTNNNDPGGFPPEAATGELQVLNRSNG